MVSLDVIFLFSYIPGPIIAKFFFVLAKSMKPAKASLESSVSGFNINAYFVLTFLRPILLAFPYPKFSPGNMHSTF